MSHTNTGEWQSFELRMRRRRAERLVLRAEAAADNGCPAEAREALAEARQLVPSLPDFDRIEQKLSAADETRAPERPVAERPVAELPLTELPVAELPMAALAVTELSVEELPVKAFPVEELPVEELPVAELPVARPLVADPLVAEPSIAALPIQDPPAAIVESSSGWKNTLTAIAAMLVLLAAGGIFAFTLLGPGDALTSRDLRATAQLIDTPGAGFTPRVVETPKPEPLPAVESIEPTGTAGYLEPPRPAVNSSEVGTRAPETALPPRLVNVTLPPAEVKASNEVKNPAELKPVAENADLPRLPVNTAAETRLAEPAIPAPAAPPTPAPAAAPAASPAVSQDALVKAALDRYAAAYTRLDADAAQRVWPGVNRAALAHAFDGLASQRVSLADCRIDVTGDKAVARCAGWTTWQPKVGATEPRTDQRTWTFELARAGEGWQIVNARAQNR